MDLETGRWKQVPRSVVGGEQIRLSDDEGKDLGRLGWPAYMPDVAALADSALIRMRSYTVLGLGHKSTLLQHESSTTGGLKSG